VLISPGKSTEMLDKFMFENLPCYGPYTCFIVAEHFARKQSSPATRHGGAWGGGEERRYSSYSFLTWALHGVSGQRHAPAALCSGERTPGTYCTGGWVGLRAGLGTAVRGKILFPCQGSNPDRPVVQSVVRHCTD
jgi:hypothetical protein